MRHRLLISVADTTGIERFGALAELGWEIISTGKTAEFLKKKEVPVTLIEDVIGYPEVIGGDVRIIHPKVLNGILANLPDPTRFASAITHGDFLVHVLVANLRNPRGNLDIGQIEIGVPTLIRAAAKNVANVAVVTDRADYTAALGYLRTTREVPLDFRIFLAGKAFTYVSRHDAEIAAWFERADLGDLGDKLLLFHPPAGRTKKR